MQRYNPLFDIVQRLVESKALGEFLHGFFENYASDEALGHCPALTPDAFGLHPHSGIATLTYLAEGSVNYEDTNGATGVLPAGGVEWMQAGGGVWHGPATGAASHLR